MIRAVIDTNVFVSGLINRAGTPGRLVQAWQRGQFVLVSSPAILMELAAVLADAELMKRYHISPEAAQQILTATYLLAEVVKGDASVRVTIRDPDDLEFLAAAVEGSCQYIVTGDRELLRLGRYQGVQVVLPAWFLHQLGPLRSP